MSIDEIEKKNYTKKFKTQLLKKLGPNLKYKKYMRGHHRI